MTEGHHITQLWSHAVPSLCGHMQHHWMYLKCFSAVPIWDQSEEVKWKSLSHVWLFATPWSVACQAPLSMEFSRQEYWSGLPFPPPGSFWPRDQIRVFCLADRSLLSEPPGKPKMPAGAAAKPLSRAQLCATPWTAAHQAPLSLGFSRKEHWSGVPLPSLQNVCGDAE